MQEQPKEILVVIIKHAVNTYDASLIDKIMLAAREKKPEMMITPQFSLPSDKLVNQAYRLLRKESPGTVLISARNHALIKTPEPDFDPFEDLDYQVLVYPHYEKKFTNLDLLINIGKVSPEEAFRNDKRLRIGGYFIRLIDDINYFVARKIINQGDKVLDPVYPCKHKNMKAYERYELKMD